MTNKISRGLRPARWWKMWEKPSHRERVTSQGWLPGKKWTEGNIIRMHKMIECLAKEFLMYFGRLQHRRTARCLWPDGGSRALEAAHCWVLWWERGGSQGLCQLARHGAEVSRKPLTVALQASCDCVKLQHGTRLSREDGSGTAFPLLLES